MKIGIQSWGSEGDNRPFIYLTQALANAGHDVTLVLSNIDNARFDEFTTGGDYSIRYTPPLFESRGEFKKLADKTFKLKNNLKQFQCVFEEMFDPMVKDIYPESLNLCNNNDLVISHFAIWPMKLALRVIPRPHITVATTPAIIPSAYFPPANLPHFGRMINSVIWKLGMKALSGVFNKNVSSVCKRLDIPYDKMKCEDALESELLSLVESSPTLFPKPPDWDEHRSVCGFFQPQMETGEELPDGLESFLNSGEPPVYLTFGSMMIFETEAERIVRMFMKAAQNTGCRAIVQCDHKEMLNIDFPESVFHLHRAPHSKVFPQCSVVIHHGGAGTSHTASLHGCPSVVVVFGVDQHFWGRRLHQTGIAPPALLRRKINEKQLTRAMKKALSPGMKKRAEEISRQMQQENGTLFAVDLIEQVICDTC